MKSPSYQPIRSLLFVPGNRPDRFDKAIDSGADAVVVDLEDAVPLDQKDAARDNVREKLASYSGKRILVRVNALGTDFFEADLFEIVSASLWAIMVPKVNSPSDVRKICEMVGKAEKRQGIKIGTIALLPLIESASGLQHIFAIVSQQNEPARMFSAAFGALDYALDMGTDVAGDGSNLDYARSRIAVACRAAGVAPPLDTPYTKLKDEQGLRSDALRARQLGFQGKLCIHPDQTGICNDVFGPTKEQIEFAEKVIEAFEQAEAKGLGAIQVEGRMVDAPIVAWARQTLKWS